MSTLQHTISTISALAPFLGSATLRGVQSIGSKAQDRAGVNHAPLPPSWQAMLAVRAQAIRELKPGWDGPRSISPSTATLSHIYLLTYQALGAFSSAVAPYVVPAGDGSLQLEWHESHGELEMLVSPGGELSIWIRLHQGNIELEGDGEEALALFYRWAPWMAAHHNDERNVSVPASCTFLELAA